MTFQISGILVLSDKIVRWLTDKPAGTWKGGGGGNQAPVCV